MREMRDLEKDAARNKREMIGKKSRSPTLKCQEYFDLKKHKSMDLERTEKSDTNFQIYLC